MEVMNVARAAEVLDVSPRRVRQLLESGQLAGQQLGRSWVIDRSDIDTSPSQWCRSTVECIVGVGRVGTRSGT